MYIGALFFLLLNQRKMSEKKVLKMQKLKKMSKFLEK